jgi:O-antigen ligase
MALLLASALPLALWALREARSFAGRAAAAATALLFVGSIVASGSRGALVAASAGAVVLGLAVARGRRERLAAVGGAVLLLGLGAALMQVPQAADTDPVISPRIVPLPPVPFSPQEAQQRLPLESEIGYPRPEDLPIRRSLLETSGRLPAWKGAVGQAAERSLVGYGFGTEEEVFVDRYYRFISDRVENSFLGTALELGLVGLVLLLALLAAIARRGRLALASLVGAERRVAAACAGVAVAGLVICVTQSFLTSPGSPAAAPFWLSAFLLAALSGGSADARPGLDERQRDEREHEAPDGHREAGLDVVRPQHGRVGEEEQGHPPRRAVPAETEHEPGRRQHEQEPVDGG